MFSKVEDRAKLTFKDKVVQIFLKMPGYKADLKTLVEQYIQMFGEGEPDGDSHDPLHEERKKVFLVQRRQSKATSRKL